jgi:hypothetical protein
MGDQTSYDRYTGESWSVVVRAADASIEEVEIHGLVARSVVTASGRSIRRQADGSFEIDLTEVAASLAAEGSTELAGQLRRRGVSRILFDWVGEVALRARLDGESESALVLNRDRGGEGQGVGRLPAGSPASPTDLLPFEKFSPNRY